MVRWNEDGPELPPGEAAALIREHLAYDEKLRAGGHLVESGSLQLEDAATLVRVRGGKTSATDGPYAETKEHLGGFYVVEARDRDEAVRLAAGIPSARNGWIEVRPYRDLYRDLDALDGRVPPEKGAAMGKTPDVKLEKPRIQEVGPTRLTGLMGDYTPATMREIAALWPRFVEQLQRARLSGVGGKVSYGAGFHCFDGSPTFQYMCAVEVSDFTGVPAGWARIDVPKRRYAIFTHREHVSRLGDTINAIRESWLPGSGHDAALGGGAPDFLELYGEGFDPSAGTGDLEVWFPIR
jgi:predicted transcriptional regulator YdeE